MVECATTLSRVPTYVNIAPRITVINAQRDGKFKENMGVMWKPHIILEKYVFSNKNVHFTGQGTSVVLLMRENDDALTETETNSIIILKYTKRLAVNEIRVFRQTVVPYCENVPGYVLW